MRSGEAVRSWGGAVSQRVSREFGLPRKTFPSSNPNPLGYPRPQKSAGYRVIDTFGYPLGRSEAKLNP